MFIKTEKETIQLAQNLAQCCPSQKRIIIFFEGELGAGKTFFIRSFLNTLGYRSFIKSPTYTLMEKYNVGPFLIYHLDLYRFQSANEIFDMGLIDEWDSQGIWLIEWPNRASAFLPQPDIVCRLDILKTGRHIQFLAKSPDGKPIIQCLNKRLNPV
ncbi:tRNA (N6-adenosine(37)-N6)-threonylcarbamoyltransferase complex ATPase TsaE [Rickettsiella grylli]|uniref:tRNA (adenosine(37)-N6)-threonylcarbamoyltransferase complex ATPase subunit type 1 TsaE n=1 Tax=Rickettsiella grylli TaxID=59196 RepID=UPI0008FCEDFC|nr:tRNA (adenosine(37)-N6)-threonylcarbamoyltransferase complex ATPase subunit type 1 TsaE [Rickettsiella grylli]OIZ97951.1 tRNA (N6-adenosine(37)-N6)-threonylcarbamoyltransferase complex ATPase TsaE [Rickettsiella grylli]